MREREGDTAAGEQCILGVLDDLYSKNKNKNKNIHIFTFLFLPHHKCLHTH